MTTGAFRQLAAAAVFLSIGCAGGSSGGDPGLQCDAGQHVCGSACASDASPLTCGTSCQPCPGTANGDPACTAGACTIDCRAGYAPCQTGCCQALPPAGSVQVEFTWPLTGQPLSSGVRLEVAFPGRIELLDAPATSLSLEGMEAGEARFRLRLLDGQGQVLARGGGVVEIGPAAAWLPVSTDASGLSGCDIVDTTPEEDLAVDLGGSRSLTPAPRDGWVALLLPPAELAWSVAGTGVATIDAATGLVTPIAPGHADVTLRCGAEPAPAFHIAVVSPPDPMHASTTLFVRDPASSDAAPVARLAVDPPAADYDFTFRLDASATSDDGPASALRWRFDWEGDGTWDTAFGTRSDSFHMYGWAATFSPRVQVVDGGGRTGRASLALPVAVPVGVRVRLDSTAASIWLNFYREPTFTATVTGAADTSVTWTMLEGSSEVAGGCLISTATTCTYGPPRYGGFYHLVATANADPAKKALAEIEVHTQPPMARCQLEIGNGVSTDWAIVGQQVRLDGAGSADPDHTSVSYAWWYQDDGVGPKVPLAGTGDAIAPLFDSQGTRLLGLDVTDAIGEVGSAVCGTVTWAPAQGIPMGESVGAAYWDDPRQQIEYVVTANGGSPATYGVVGCTFEGSCMRRFTSDGCLVEGTGLGAPYLACGSGSWYVTGPGTGAEHLWTGDAGWGWRPVQNTWGEELVQVNVAGRGYDCLSGPFCP